MSTYGPLDIRAIPVHSSGQPGARRSVSLLRPLPCIRDGTEERDPENGSKVEACPSGSLLSFGRYTMKHYEFSAKASYPDPKAPRKECSIERTRKDRCTTCPLMAILHSRQQHNGHEWPLSRRPRHTPSWASGRAGVEEFESAFN